MAKLFLNESLLKVALRHINEGLEGGGLGLDPDKMYWATAGSSYVIEFKLKGSDISYCSQGMGSDNYQNAMELISKRPDIQEQLNGVSDEQLDKWWFEDFFLDGMSDEEKASATREQKLAFALADACCNAADGDAEEAEDDVPAALPDNDEMGMLKESIKGMIRESLYNMFGPDMMEKHTLKSKHSQNNKHKTKPKTAGQARHTKRAIVIQWLKDPANAVNGAEIMRQLWHPSPEDEDTKRGEFYKKRDGAINKDTGARYSFSDEEINALYRIKSHTG